MAGVLQEAGDADSRVPDTKCKFITSPFLTLPYLLDCLICTRNAMPIVLLLKLMEHSPGAGGGGGGGWFLFGCGWGDRGLVSSFFLFLYFVVPRSQSLNLSG